MREDIAIAVEIYHARADQTNDVHDHDELHAAGAVLAMLNGAVLTEKEFDYIERWLLGLVEKF